MIIRKEGLTYKGTRILAGAESAIKRDKLNECVTFLRGHGFMELSIPIIQFADTFALKVGEENNNMMFNFTDRGDRNLVLAPEYTAVVQQLSKTNYKTTKDLPIFYIGECFRGENPQFGRYRQFTQLGVEMINPKKDHTEFLIGMAKTLISKFYLPLTVELADKVHASMVTNRDAVRGLDYYVDPTTKLPLGKGFEITCDILGTAAQICGGGTYDGGQGFAIGVDRLLLLNQKVNDGSAFTEER